MFSHSVILAAGRGERMKPITDYVPKALCKDEGLTLLHSAIHSLPDISLSITYSYLGDQILRDFWNYKHNISFIHTNGNDNAWFIHNSPIGYMSEPIIVIPCDISFSINWEDLYNEFINRNSEYMIVPVTSNYEGDSLYSINGKITTMTRTLKYGKIASGIQLFKPNTVPNYSGFNNIWNFLIRNKKLDISETEPTNWKARDYV